jgi:hypothetical protein
VEVKPAGRTNLEVALEVLLLHRIATRLTFSKEALAEGLLLGSVDSRFGLGELRHSGSLA